MTEFNDTVRISDLPEAAEGQTLIVPAVDGEGHNVKKDLAPDLERGRSNSEAIAAANARITAVAGLQSQPLSIEMDRHGEKNDGSKGGNKEATEKQDGGDFPEQFTVRISHKPCERNAGKSQRLEYSTDGGKSWTPFEPTGNLTLAPEDQAQMESLLADIQHDGHAELKDYDGSYSFESEEEVAEYFEAKKGERVDIEVSGEGRLLLRGKCDTLEGFNITTLGAEVMQLPDDGEADSLYKEGLDLVGQLEPGKPFAFFCIKGYNYPKFTGGFSSRVEAEQASNEVGGRTWIVTDETEFEAMWDEFRETVNVTVPFVCGGDILSLLDWETPDPKAAEEVPFAFAGLFEESTVAVGPELPAVLGEGTWAKFYRRCKYLREVSARWSISEWVRRARAGIGKDFPTGGWLEGASGSELLKLKWEEAAPMMLVELARMGSLYSLTAGLTVKPMDTRDVLGKRVDEVGMVLGEMYEEFSDLYSKYGRMPRVMNFTVPPVLYDPTTDVLSWHWYNQAFGFGFGVSQTVNILELRFLVYLKNSSQPAPISSSVSSGSAGGFSNHIGNVKRIVVVGIGTLIEDGQSVVSEPHLVWDEGLHTKEEIMSWVGAVFHYKGHKATVADLPAEGNEVGDAWNVRSTGANYAWDGEAWDKLSETVDLSGVAMSTDLAGVATSGSYNDLTDKPPIPARGSQTHFVTAAELVAAQTAQELVPGDWYVVTDSGQRSVSLATGADTVLTTWQEQV